MTKEEEAAVTKKESTRDMELKPSDPMPTKVVLNRNKKTDRLVTRVNLVHR